MSTADTGAAIPRVSAVPPRRMGMPSRQSAGWRLPTLLMGVIAGTVIASAVWLVARHTKPQMAPLARPHASEPNGVEAAAHDLGRQVARRQLEALPTIEHPAAPSAGTAPPSSPEPAEQTAAGEAEVHLARLESSGPAPDGFLKTTGEVRAEWLAMAHDQNIAISMTPWRCFKAGCYSTQTFKSAADQLITERMAESKGFNGWQGGKFRSGLIPDGEGFRVVWVFFAPPDPIQTSTVEGQ